MVWYAWAVVVFVVLNAIAQVAITGQAKRPAHHTAAQAVANIVYAGLVTWAVVSLAT